MTCASVNSSELESVHFVLQTEEKFRSTKLALSLPLKMDSADGLSQQLSLASVHLLFGCSHRKAEKLSGAGARKEWGFLQCLLFCSENFSRFCRL